MKNVKKFIPFLLIGGAAAFYFYNRSRKLADKGVRFIPAAPPGNRVIPVPVPIVLGHKLTPPILPPPPQVLGRCESEVVKAMRQSRSSRDRAYAVSIASDKCRGCCN